MTTKNGDIETHTTVSLRAYVDMRFAEAEKAMIQAREQMAHRLDTMNQFREALKDQAAQMVTRRELLAELTPLKTELQELRDFRITLQAKASQQSVYITLLIALAGLILNIVDKLGP